MFKFTVTTTSTKLTDLLTPTQVEALRKAKSEVWYRFILQNIKWWSDIHIYVWDWEATLDSYILYSWNEKEDTYRNIDYINLIASWVDNTDIRIITT